MIDYWEALGRIVYDEATGQAFAQLAEPLASKFGPVPPGVAKSVPLDIAGADYEAVQNFWAPRLTQPYLSLMAAGELIWSYYYKQSQDKLISLREAVIATNPNFAKPSTTYFISLGLIIADKDFRKQVVSGKLETLPSGQLSTQEKANLVSLASNSSFANDAVAFCEFPWDGGCNVLSVYWEGHLHPRGIDKESGWGDSTPDSTSGQGQADHALVGAH